MMGVSVWGYRREAALEGLDNSDWWVGSLEAPGQLYALEFVFVDPSTGATDNKRRPPAPAPPAGDRRPAHPCSARGCVTAGAPSLPLDDAAWPWGDRVQTTWVPLRPLFTCGLRSCPATSQTRRAQAAELQVGSGGCHHEGGHCREAGSRFPRCRIETTTGPSPPPQPTHSFAQPHYLV